MRKSIVFVAFLFCAISFQAQSTGYNITAGDILVLGQPSGSKYAHIEFPRKNTILKRGAIADFKSLIGKHLVVQRIETGKNDADVVILIRKDGLNFFRFFPEAKANVYKAFEAGELRL